MGIPRVSWVCAATLLCLSSVASAADTKKAVADGVTLITRTRSSPSLVVHVLEVDFGVPGVHFGATASNERRRTTSSYAKLVSAAAAINGDLFSYATYATQGLAAGNGAAWADTKDDARKASIAFDAKTRVELHPQSELVKFDPTWMRGVVSGDPQIVTGGVALAKDPSHPACPTLNPRSAFGLSKDRKKAWLAVVDGRSSASVGVTCTSLGAILKELGAHDAINLDGGGSSTMYVRGTGVVNRPSDGSERVVANHLAVFAPKLGSVGSVSGVVFANGDPSKKLEGAKVTIGKGGTDNTDAAGVYDLDTLPGTFDVTAAAPGYASKTTKVTVAAGKDVKLDVGLDADPNADFDHDGIPDSKDVCPEIDNRDQLDTDHDGVGDVCDGDDDGDGRADEDDPCPLTPDEPLADGSCPVASADGPHPNAQAPKSAPDGTPTEDIESTGCSAAGGVAEVSSPIVLGFVLFAMGWRRRRKSRVSSPSR